MALGMLAFISYSSSEEEEKSEPFCLRWAPEDNTKDFYSEKMWRCHRSVVDQSSSSEAQDGQCVTATD